MVKKIIILFIALALPACAMAQQISLGTNLVDWGNLGTANLELGVSVGQHFSLMAGGRYNPWTMNSKKHDQLMQNHKQTAYLGVRYWPWYVNSGWWFAAKGQYSRTSNCGVWRPDRVDATAFGGGLSGGYTLMLRKHLNLDMGIGAWAGKYTDYIWYECPDCKDIVTSGPRAFLLLDDITISLTYVF